MTRSLRVRLSPTAKMQGNMYLDQKHQELMNRIKQGEAAVRRMDADLLAKLKKDST